jgi:hypothetical protein
LSKTQSLLDGYTGYKEYYDDILHVEASKKFKRGLILSLKFLKNNTNDELISHILSHSGNMPLRQFKSIKRNPNRRLDISNKMQGNLELFLSQFSFQFH